MRTFWLVFFLALGVRVAASESGDWATVGNDPGGSKFSALTQITPANVSRLAKAWTYDLGIPANGYTSTPIVIGNVMYLSLIHISEPTRLLSISYAVFCLKKKKTKQ